MITSSDISIVLSGGASNTDPNSSLGGDPSPFQITSSINNLFSDVSSDDAANGLVDYRCIYIFNDNVSDSYYNVNVSVSFQSDSGSFIDIGVLSRNEVQELSINGSPTAGSIKLTLDSIETSAITFNTNLSIFASNIQTALSAISAGITTAVAMTPNTITITFGGASGNRNFPLLTVSNNSLTPSSPDPSIVVDTEGGPVNDIAADIEVATNIPNMVEFTSSPVSVGTLNSEDGFPLWVRRTTSAGTDALADDNFTLLIKGTVFP